MLDDMITMVKDIICKEMAIFVMKDARDFTLKNEAFLRNIKSGENATIHLSRKYLPFVVRETVDKMLNQQRYVVVGLKYRFWGMDVFVSCK